jgi:very-short-patch-repair endonuclease
MPFYHRTGPATLKAARELRREMTDAEKRLWSRLRGRQLGNHKFRRQAQINPYIVDFCCLRQKLVIEVDGGQHAEMMQEDAERTAHIEARGYRVLRFWNNDVMRNTDGVVDTIARALGVIPD